LLLQIKSQAISSAKPSEPDNRFPKFVSHGRTVAAFSRSGVGPDVRKQLQFDEQH
jgi:hypothetical protein